MYWRRSTELGASGGHVLRCSVLCLCSLQYDTFERRKKLTPGAYMPKLVHVYLCAQLNDLDQGKSRHPNILSVII